MFAIKASSKSLKSNAEKRLFWSLTAPLINVESNPSDDEVENSRSSDDDGSRAELLWAENNKNSHNLFMKQVRGEEHEANHTSNLYTDAVFVCPAFVV